MDMADPTTSAGFIALAIAFVKLIEKFIEWTVEKFKGEKPEKIIVVELAAEPSRMIRETYEQMSEITKIVERVGETGAPLVYGPRHELSQLAAAVDAVGEKVDDLSNDVESALKKKGE